MRNRNLPKWFAYGFVILLIAVFQGTPFLLPKIMGCSPILLIPSIISLAMAEEETVGAAYGIAAGLIWDVECGRAFGGNAIFLLIVGLATGLLIQLLFRNTVVSALIFSSILTFFYELFSWFVYDYLAGTMNFVYTLLHIMLPTTGYTLLFTVPLFYGARALSKKLTPEEQSDINNIG